MCPFRVAKTYFSKVISLFPKEYKGWDTQSLICKKNEMAIVQELWDYS